ncbi:hypothetical protein [Methylobacterium sp. CM6247]
MATLNISPAVLAAKIMAAPHAPSRVAVEPAQPPPLGCATGDPAKGSDAALPDNFETEAAMVQEDRLRARHARRVLNRPGPTNWVNLNDRVWLAKQQSSGVFATKLDGNAIEALISKLVSGVATGQPALTLASALRMRAIRMALGRAKLDAFAEYHDNDLRTVTVIYSGWAYTPATLDGVTASQIKAQFTQHLIRAGVTAIPGPLFAMLHGEFEASSGVFQLHFHIITTKAKAVALLRLPKVVKGYTKTATGARPVRCSLVGNRIRQFTYLAKAFWPGKPVVLINGVPKRVHGYRRIPEPFGTQVLLWLDRQRLADLIVMNGCWSPRKGGTPAMRRLYLLAQGGG